MVRWCDCHIPDELGYRPKWQIALELAQAAMDANIPKGLVLADSGYGDTHASRVGIKELGLKYAVDVKQHTQVRIACSDGTISDTMNVSTVADVLGWREYRRVTWRQGTRRALRPRFAAVRVHVMHDSEFDPDEQWLVIERPTKPRRASEATTSAPIQTWAGQETIECPTSLESSILQARAAIGSALLRSRSPRMPNAYIANDSRLRRSFMSEPTLLKNSSSRAATAISEVFGAIPIHLMRLDRWKTLWK